MSPASEEASPAIQVSAGLVFHQHKLLITQRLADSHLGGMWEFPGGKLEPGETSEACLKRELMEELGIEVHVGSLFECVTHRYPEKSVVIRFYQCQWVRNEPRPIGCAAFAWVTSGELDHYVFPAADQQLLHRLRTEKSVWME